MRNSTVAELEASLTLSMFVAKRFARQTKRKAYKQKTRSRDHVTVSVLVTLEA